MASRVQPVTLNDKAATESASRGLIAKLDPPVIRDSSGSIIWNNSDYSFLDAQCPDTVDPKLWRQGHCRKNDIDVATIIWDYIKEQLQTEYHSRTYKIE